MLTGPSPFFRIAAAPHPAGSKLPLRGAFRGIFSTMAWVRGRENVWPCNCIRGEVIKPHAHTHTRVWWINTSIHLSGRLWNVKTKSVFHVPRLSTVWSLQYTDARQTRSHINSANVGCVNSDVSKDNVSTTHCSVWEQKCTQTHGNFRTVKVILQQRNRQTEPSHPGNINSPGLRTLKMKFLAWSADGVVRDVTHTRRHTLTAFHIWNSVFSLVRRWECSRLNERSEAALPLSWGTLGCARASIFPVLSEDVYAVWIPSARRYHVQGVIVHVS